MKLFVWLNVAGNVEYQPPDAGEPAPLTTLVALAPTEAEARALIVAAYGLSLHRGKAWEQPPRVLEADHVTLCGHALALVGASLPGEPPQASGWDVFQQTGDYPEEERNPL